MEEKEFRKGSMMKIEINSQAARELMKDEKTREKWEKRGWICYIVGEEDVPAGNKLIKVGIHPGDPNPDYLFPKDLKPIESGILIFKFKSPRDLEKQLTWSLEAVRNITRTTKKKKS